MNPTIDVDTARELLAAVEAMAEGVAIFDADDRLVMCNRRFTEFFPGMEQFLMPGLQWQILLEEARRHGVDGGLEQIDLHLESGAESGLRVEAQRPGRRWLRMGIQNTPSGGFVLSLADTTEANQAAQLKAEADELLRKVLDACAANLMMTRIGDGEILYRNPASARLFGRRRSAREIFADPARRPDMLAELLATGAVDGFEAKLLRADGSVFPARVSARLVDYGGEDVIVSSASDMTQLYAQRDELARQREATFQNEKLTALGELLAGVAHELNNPLSVVVGQSMMLSEEAAGGPLSRRVGIISQSAERCARIVKTFLAMARQKPAQLVPVSLNEMVEAAVDVAGHGLGDGLRMALAPDLPPVLADEDQIAQVIVNLLVNAEQATAARGDAAEVVVSTAVRPEDDMVTVEVRDNGPGIPAGLKARIFEPFFTTKSEGSGVGLTLCHRIVDGHSGVLVPRDAPGGGTIFRLSLPVAVSAQMAAEVDADATPELYALLVEDEADVADMLRDMLASLGVRTKVAASAEAALQIVEEGGKPDVILSDLKMPGMGGEGLLRTLRQRWPALVARTAFITGDSMARETERLDRPVLEKPVIPRELRRLLRDLVGPGMQS